METTGDEELKMSEEITPKEYQANHTDCTDVVETSQQDRTMGLVDKQLVFANFRESADSRVSEWDYQRNLDQMLGVTRSLMEVDEKTKVGYLEQIQVQHLDPQATEEVLDKLLGRTL